MTRVEFDLSGLPVSIASDVPAIVEAFENAWKPFRVDGARRFGDPLLDLVIRVDAGGTVNTDPISKDMECSILDAMLEVRTRDAVARAAADGSCEVIVGVGPPAAQFYAVANAVFAVVAWRLQRFGGVLLHAAALVIDRRAFLLVGPSGSGKSTWAWSGRDEGAEFVSDDMVAVRLLRTRPVVLSLPFRGNHPTPLPPDHWDLGAVLFPKWGPTPALESVPPLAAHVALEASVLYRDLLKDGGPLGEIIDAIAAVPARTLVFGRDGAFVEALRNFK